VNKLSFVGCGEGRTAAIVDSCQIQERCGSFLTTPYGLNTVVWEKLVGLGYGI
jgi:hypothetical protein